MTVRAYHPVEDVLAGLLERRGGAAVGEFFVLLAEVAHRLEPGHRLEQVHALLLNRLEVGIFRDLAAERRDGRFGFLRRRRIHRKPVMVAPAAEHERNEFLFLGCLADFTGFFGHFLFKVLHHLVHGDLAVGLASLGVGLA